MEENDLFNKWQRAYRPGKEGSEHLYRLHKSTQTGLKNRWSTGAVFLDVEKAFDSVWHDGLRYKINQYGLPDKIIRLLASFIQKRTIAVRIHEEYSISVPLNAGTPQGSVLSPLLFLIYVNDIPIDPKNKIQVSQFADDLGLWSQDRNTNRIQIRLQAALKDLEAWCSIWRIKLNPTKTQVTLFTKKRRNNKLKLKLFGQDIEETNNPTLLGITVDKTLTYKHHISNITQKANGRINLLRMLRGTNWGASPKTLLHLYKSFIRPVLEYGNAVTADCNNARLKTVATIERKALKIALRLPIYTPSALVYEAADITPIRQRLIENQEKTLNRIKHSKLMNELEQNIISMQ